MNSGVTASDYVCKRNWKLSKYQSFVITTNECEQVIPQF